jgi:hypothetical protein
VSISSCGRKRSPHSLAQACSFHFAPEDGINLQVNPEAGSSGALHY